MTAELALPDPPDGLELSRTSLRVLRLPTFEHVETVLSDLLGMGDSVRWWVGDLLLFAEANFQEEYAQALSVTRLSERQLTKYRWVAEKVAPSLRRENLSFTHHEIVAALPPPDQERLLAMAETGGHSVAAFREIIADHKAFENQETLTRARAIVLAPVPATVDAARGLRTARATLRTVGSTSPEVAENLKIPEAIRGIDHAAKVVQRADLLEEVLDAAEAVLASGVIQIGLPDPAVIVPSAAWDRLHAAHAQATEGRKKK
jgi:hypothetical protein